jgi:hypothetical protein
MVIGDGNQVNSLPGWEMGYRENLRNLNFASILLFLFINCFVIGLNLISIGAHHSIILYAGLFIFLVSFFALFLIIPVCFYLYNARILMGNYYRKYYSLNVVYLAITVLITAMVM